MSYSIPYDSFAHILAARYFQKGSKTPYDILCSLLRMSTKYMINSIRQDVIVHLKDIFPSSLAAMHQKYRDIHSSGPHPHDCIRAVIMAKECNVRAILPAAYYFCC